MTVILNLWEVRGAFGNQIGKNFMTPGSKNVEPRKLGCRAFLKLSCPFGVAGQLYAFTLRLSEARCNCYLREREPCFCGADNSWARRAVSLCSGWRWRGSGGECWNGALGSQGKRYQVLYSGCALESPSAKLSNRDIWAPARASPITFRAQCKTHV